jgi:glycosyltransferase involved in cell wall biosynthesis
MILVEYLGKKGIGPEMAFDYVKYLTKHKEIHMLLSDQNPFLDELIKLKNLKLILINTRLDTFTKKIKFIIKWILKSDKNLTNNLGNYESIFIPMISLRTQFVVKYFSKHKKIIFCVHDPKPHKGDKFKHFIIRQNFIIKMSDSLVFHSMHYENYYKNLFFNKDIQYIPLVVSKNSYKNLKIVKDQKIYFVFFGRITKYKGIKYLLNAFIKLAVYSDKVNLIIAGEGDIELPKKIQKIPERIKIINEWVDEETISNIYSYHKCITVLPYIEGTQSGVIVKSFEHCVPVIITNIKGLKEQVRENYNGFIIERKSTLSLFRKMKFITDNDGLITKMRENINFDISQNDFETKFERLKDMIL